MGDDSTLYGKQYGQNIMILSQQKGSRLRNAVMFKSASGWEDFFMDQMGARTAKKRTTRHADTPIIDQNYQRRRIQPFDYEDAVLLDKQDNLKMLNDPTSNLTLSTVYSLGRAIDDEIISAFFGTSYSGQEGGTSVSFPNAQKIAVASSGLTVAKLISAKELLDAAETGDPEEERYIACQAKQISNLLGTTQVTSSDYNTVKALVRGEIDTFLGFKFIRTQRLGTSSSNRLVAAWQKSGMALVMQQDIESRVDVRVDKSMAKQVYACVTFGATRLEEEKVVQISCSES